MLLLLPPSEGKTPPSGAPLDLTELAFHRALGATRRKVLAASGAPRKLRAAPAGPASEVYTGVLYGRLDFASLPPAATARAADDVLIASALWGLLRPSDRIPHYSLPAGTPLPRLERGLVTMWRAPLTKALADRDVDDELIVDLRSGPYAAFWRPGAAQHLAVRAFRVNPDGSRQVISHMAKASRGDVARALLCADRVARTPQDVADIAAAAGMRVELTTAPELVLAVLED